MSHIPLKMSVISLCDMIAEVSVDNISTVFHIKVQNQINLSEGLHALNFDHCSTPHHTLLIQYFKMASKQKWICWNQVSH